MTSHSDTNTAAERLLYRIDMIGEAENVAIDMKSYAKNLEEALAFERRATVERIRAALRVSDGWMSDQTQAGTDWTAIEDSYLDAILDAETER